MAITVYCDEAGYTGDDLREENQPYFAYAGVAIGPEESAEIVQEVRQLIRIQAPELKGKHLYTHRAAVDAVELLVRRLNGRAAYVVHNKAFALGGKFFEYALEPALSAKSSFFYQTNFHRFIANLMYLFLSSGDADAEEVLNHFVKMMRRKSGETAGLFANSLRLTDDPRSIITDIMRLVRSKQVRLAIEEELEDISDEQGRILWMLDLSLGSCVMVLRHLSAHYGELTVTLDESKPLVAAVDRLNMLGSIPLANVMGILADGLPFNFQLSEPIQFASSANEPGLQLADLVASVVSSTMRDHSTEKAQAMLRLLLPLACNGNVNPDTEHIDLTTTEARFNAQLLVRLANRAEAGIPLLAPGLFD